MKTMILTLALTGWSCTGIAGQLCVDVTGFEQTQGQVMIALHDQAQDFSGDKALRQGRVSPQAAHWCTTDLPNGTYAIKLFHDANDNGALDTNLLGIPKERYGFSNNPKGLGPASFEAARFSVSGDTQLHIELR